MTLDEAIKHCLEVTEKYETQTEEWCKECAADHKQLAEWLRELVVYKRLEICGNCRHYVSGTTHFGECHVTSYIEPCIVGVNQTACDTFFEYKDLEMGVKNNDT